MNAEDRYLESKLKFVVEGWFFWVSFVNTESG